MAVYHQGLDNEQGIDRICLGLPDSGLSQSCCLYGIDDRYAVTVIMKKEQKVFSVMSGRLHADKDRFPAEWFQLV